MRTRLHPITRAFYTSDRSTSICSFYIFLSNIQVYPFATFTTFRRIRDRLDALVPQRPLDHPRPRFPPPCRRLEAAVPDHSNSLMYLLVPKHRSTPMTTLPRTHPQPKSVSHAVLSRTSPDDDDAI